MSDEYIDKTTEQGDSKDLGTIKFRNYKPCTHFSSRPHEIHQSEPASISHLIEDKLKLIGNHGINDGDAEDDDGNRYSLDPEMLDPKKIDWDLKCRINKKLERLERETKKQIDNYVKNQRTKGKQ